MHLFFFALCATRGDCSSSESLQPNNPFQCLNINLIRLGVVGVAAQDIYTIYFIKTEYMLLEDCLVPSVSNILFATGHGNSKFPPSQNID